MLQLVPDGTEVLPGLNRRHPDCDGSRRNVGLLRAFYRLAGAMPERTAGRVRRQCDKAETTKMSKFKEALERGKEARRQHVKDAHNGKTERDIPMTDFDAQARAWLDDVVIASLEAAKADVAGEMTVDIDIGQRPRAQSSIPSIRFQIYRKRGLEKKVRRTFTVSVQLSGEVSVSARGIVAKEVGNIGDRSDERFRNLVAKLIEDAANGT